MNTRELPIVSAWVETVEQVLELAGRFPRNLRPTLGQRLVDRTLDVLDGLIEIRYRRAERADRAAAVNLCLEQIRFLTRIAFARRVISSRQYESLSRSVDRCGRMLGGWAKSWAHRRPKTDESRTP